MAVVLAGIYGGFFGPTGQAALGVLSFAITALLQSPILSSGTWPTGWEKSIWVAQIAGVCAAAVAAACVTSPPSTGGNEASALISSPSSSTTYLPSPPTLTLYQH